MSYKCNECGEDREDVGTYQPAEGDRIILCDDCASEAGFDPGE